MRRLVSVISLLLTICVLSACAPRQDFQYTPPTNKTRLKCIASCKIATSACMQICGLKNNTCRAEMEADATERYTAYKTQRHARHQPVRRSYADYLRTSTCEHSCNCLPSYNTCYRACGGRID